MRFLFLLIVLFSAGANAWAAPQPQLAFEQGNAIVLNPDSDGITLRSAAVDRVRLQLYKLPDETAENQVVTARVTQSVTENGLLARVVDGRAPQWQSDFILPGDMEAVTQPVPLMAAAGQLAPGDYVLVASAEGVRVAQWFSIAPIALAQSVGVDGQAQSIVVGADRKPIPNAVVLALNTKGEVIGGGRAGDDGVAHWAMPADAVVLRAQDASGSDHPHIFLPLSHAAVADDDKSRTPALSIDPDFNDNVAPAGATAHVAVRLKGGANRGINYVFAQEQMRYQWLRDSAGLWQYHTVSIPDALQRGAVMADAKGEADIPLPVGEGRYRLTVSGAGLRNTLIFTAGWWRHYPDANVSCSIGQDNVVACAERR